MNAKDKRERVRISRSISRGADFVVKGRAYRSSIENTNDSRVFIKTKGRFSEGQDISLTIESPSEKRTGKIARVTPTVSVWNSTECLIAREGETIRAPVVFSNISPELAVLKNL